MNAAAGGALASVFLIIAGVAVIAAALASVLVVLLSERVHVVRSAALPAFIAGAALSVVSGFLIWPVALVVTPLLGGTSALATAMPLVAAAAVGAAALFQLWHRPTFSLSRVAAIAGAVSMPLIFLAVRSI